MDNNLIKIDDLVRQRLVGGEEREPSGAWLRMRELLDKEEDRKPAPFLWRRIFGAFTVFVLVASISLGGYEINSKYKILPSGNGSEPVSVTNIASPDVAKNLTAINKDNDQKNNPDLTVASNNNTGRKKLNTGKNTKYAHETLGTGQSSTKISGIPKNQYNIGNHRPVLAASATGTNSPNGLTGKHNGQITGANYNSDKTENKSNIKVASEDAAIATSSSVGKNKPTKSPVGLADNTSANRPSGKHRNTNAGIAAVKQTSGNAHAKTNSTTGKKSGSGTSATALANVPGGDPVKTSAGMAKPDDGNMDGKSVGTGETNKTNTVSTDDDNDVSNKLTVASGPVGDTKMGKKRNSNKTTSNGSGNRNSKPGNSNQLAANVSGISKSGNATVGNSINKPKTPAGNTTNRFNGSAVAIGKPVPDVNKTDNPAIKKVDTSRTRMVKKIIQAITIRQRMLQTGPNTYVTHYDTISIENINEVIAMNDETKEYGPPTLRQYMSEGKAANSSDKLIVPGADLYTADKPEGKIAKNEQSKAKGGGGGMGNLSEQFNDIKYKISGARFATGLKAGINGTFFGPSDFKGFQFGVTGNFIFSESVNILTELEYFQRINSGYVMSDDYYTYAPLGNALWSRQQIVNQYSFSTLHSFELPVIFRYSKSIFNFSAGVNLAYSMAINESNGIPTPGITTQYAGSAPGTDTKPAINAGDFNGRFGLGYLFGFAMQLSPVISVDVRDVQTFWDNAGTAGAKEVSSQLYKSPSFQLSMGYRFGAKKAKNKE